MKLEEDADASRWVWLIRWLNEKLLLLDEILAAEKLFTFDFGKGNDAALAGVETGSIIWNTMKNNNWMWQLYIF